jgi:uncharacterized protein
MDKDEVIKSLQNLKIELSKQFDIKNLYLFGSYSTNRHNKYSDIDVAIVVEKVLGNYLEFVSSIWHIAGGINSLIEPVVFVEGQNDPSGFFDMIKKTGIEVN